jgi:predicted outer membrane repeat protein
MKSVISFVSLSLVVLAVCIAPSSAATYYIKADGTGDFATIQDGILAATAGDTVLLAAGTYTGVGNRDIDFYRRAITVTSESGPEVTIIDCQGLGSGFYFHRREGPSSVVSGLTIQNGHSDFEGGAILIENASPLITNNMFLENEADYYGGVICCETGSTPTIANNTFQQNSAGVFGGGLYCYDSWPQIIDNTFSENSADLDGGGIYCAYESSPYINGNIFIGNSADNGGGIHCFKAWSRISNNTFIGNTALHSGGGIYCYLGNSIIANNTLIGNGAVVGGGIICVDTSPTIENTIIVYSSQGEGISCAASGNPTITCCDIYGNAGGDAVCGVDGGGNISENPLFCDAGSGNYHLALNSPCTQDNHPMGVLIGAWPVGCEPVSVEKATWGQMKAMYTD